MYKWINRFSPTGILVLFLAIVISSSCKRTMKIPAHIDHLIYTASSLEQGMDNIEELLGVKPAIGGIHPQYGTCNALVALGPTAYLEIIAPNPDLPEPAAGVLFEEFFRRTPSLSRWVIRDASIDSLVSEAKKNGYEMGEVSSGSRETPEGKQLSWRLSDPYKVPLDGAIPFIIDWGQTPHPSTSIPLGGQLVGFHIEHPNPEEVYQWLKIIGVDVSVKKSPHIKLVAQIETPDGVVELF